LTCAVVHYRKLKTVMYPATGAFPVKSDALCEAGEESYFLFIFSHCQRENMGFFPA